jgi:hypothetical protein
MLPQPRMYRTNETLHHKVRSGEKIAVQIGPITVASVCGTSTQRMRAGPPLAIRPVEDEGRRHRAQFLMGQHRAHCRQKLLVARPYGVSSVRRPEKRGLRIISEIAAEARSPPSLAGGLSRVGALFPITIIDRCELRSQSQAAANHLSRDGGERGALSAGFG